MRPLLLIAGVLILRPSAPEEATCEDPRGKCLRVAAVIPARAGSKGIREKNLSLLGEESLVSRAVRIAKGVEGFDSVWVSTDGERIADEGLREGARVHWRDPETATDAASTVSVVEDFLLTEKGFDVVAVVQCTSPFLQKDYLQEGLDIMLTSDADCVFSVSESFQLRWAELEDGFASPLNFNPQRRPRRQDWGGELVENGMFYIAKTSLILRNKVLQNERCKTVKIPKRFSLEIDSEDDLLLARAMLPLFQNKTSERF